jgi:SAM-dependent methyltransferase
MILYKKKSYKDRHSETFDSAELIVPHILKLLSINSVVDIGCGVGTWLLAFMNHGIKEILGVEGPWMPKEHLVIPETMFMNHDLTTSFSLKKTFDLAMSLEVAEHIPQELAESFIETLTKLAPIVLFSAAIPGQGGIGHVNEQWPDYWARLFIKNDYKPIDYIRRKIWNDDRVQWWYAQNLIMYIRSDLVRKYTLEDYAYGSANTGLLNIVHPGNYENVLKRATFKYIVKQKIKKISNI